MRAEGIERIIVEAGQLAEATDDGADRAIAQTTATTVQHDGRDSVGSRPASTLLKPALERRPELGVDREGALLAPVRALTQHPELALAGGQADVADVQADDLAVAQTGVVRQ